MDIYALDLNFNKIDVFDNYKSLIWVDRYLDVGDMEIVTPVDQVFLDAFRIGNYLTIPKSKKTMIFESIGIKSSIKEGSNLIFKGRSLESILERRCIQKQMILTGSLQSKIQQVLNENIINPTDVSRKINNFVFKASTDPAIVAATVNSQFTGDTVLDVIVSLCYDLGFGFQVVLNNQKQFEFQLLNGVNRSSGQNESPHVQFSPEFENLLSSSYLNDHTSLKNVAVVAGEGEGAARTVVTIGSTTGLNRRELYVDARDLSSYVDETTTLTPTEYQALLQRRGLEKLIDFIPIDQIEASIDDKIQYNLNVDYFIGDIVQIVNEFGMKSAARIVEILIYTEKAKIAVLPKFELV